MSAHSIWNNWQHNPNIVLGQHMSLALAQDGHKHAVKHVYTVPDKSLQSSILSLLFHLPHGNMTLQSWFVLTTALEHPKLGAVVWCIVKSGLHLGVIEHKEHVGKKLVASLQLPKASGSHHKCLSVFTVWHEYRPPHWEKKESSEEEEQEREESSQRGKGRHFCLTILNS